MADQDRNKKRQDGSREEQIGEGQNRGEEDNEWLRDQVGEDHNLSGSTTFRTLPEQPESEEEGDRSDEDPDSRKRQSNR